MTLIMYISPDAWSDDGSGLTNQAIDEFNRTHPIQIGGQDFEIDVVRVASGKAGEALENEDSADVWIPASSMWGSLLNQHRNEEAVSSDPLNLVRSPQVIAMWESEFEYLRNHGHEDIGWPDIMRFATHPERWGAAVGRPGERFGLVHTNPGVSTSGLSAAISEFSQVADTPPSELTDPIVDRYAGRIHRAELSIVHYGDIVSDLMKQLACYGPSYASAVYVQKQSVLEFNEPGFGEAAGCGGGATQEKLAWIVPKGEAFSADYPCYALSRPESETETFAGSQAFCAWLAGWFQGHPDVVTEHNFESIPAAANDGLRSVDPPPAGVIDHVQEVWREERKPASVAIAIDTSGSMDASLSAIKDKVARCLLDMTEKDRVGLIPAGNTSSDPVELAALDSAQRTDLGSAIGQLEPMGANVLWDGIWDAVATVRRTGYDGRRINAVVLLADGTDDLDGSDHHVDDLLRFVQEEPVVRVFIVTYGSDADNQGFEEIARASQGRVISSNSASGDICQSVFDYF